MNYYSIILCLVLGLFSNHTEQIVSFNEAGVSTSFKGQFVTVTIHFDILQGYHIQSESETLDDVIATEIVFEDSNSFEIISYEFTSKQNETVILNEYTHNVITSAFEVTVTIKLNEKVSALNYELGGQLYYQACTDRQCLFPRTLNFEVPNIK